MFTQADLTYAALFFTAVGFFIGVFVVAWTSSRQKKSWGKYEAPYHKFNGDPQPGSWYPGRAQHHSPRHSVDVLARMNGAV